MATPRLGFDLMEKNEQSRHDALEAVEEHHVIELLLQELTHFPKDHERWAVKLEVFAEYTRHHLDEEEDDIFPGLSDVLDQSQLDKLGDRFDELKDKQLAVL